MVVWLNPVISIYHSPSFTQTALPTRATRAARPTRAAAVLIIMRIQQQAEMSSLAWLDPSAGIGAALHLKALFVQMTMVMMLVMLQMMVILWVELMIVLVIQSVESIRWILFPLPNMTCSFEECIIYLILWLLLYVSAEHH